MAEPQSGGAKVFRGMIIAFLAVAALVLLVVFWRQVLGAFEAVGTFVADRFPQEPGQQTAVIIYLVLAVVFGVIFSKAGHFTAYGIVLGLATLLWALFWEGFPPLGLRPSWAEQAGLGHLSPEVVITWAVVGAAVTTLVFVPLELGEKYRKRKRQLG